MLNETKALLSQHRSVNLQQKSPSREMRELLYSRNNNLKQETKMQDDEKPQLIAGVKELLAKHPEKPVFMVNLLKFKEKDGLKNYLTYSKHMMPLLARAGASVVYSGNGLSLLLGSSDSRWDHVLIVRYSAPPPNQLLSFVTKRMLKIRYPSAAAFVQMTSSDEYLKVGQYRKLAIERSALLATDGEPLTKLARL